MVGYHVPAVCATRVRWPAGERGGVGAGSSLLDLTGYGDEDAADPPDIRRVLLSHRISRGMTRKALAAASGLSVGQLQKIEHRKRHVTPSSLRELLRALGIDALAHDEYVDLAYHPEIVRRRLRALEITVPEEHDLALVESLDCPAALMASASCDLLATNRQFDAAFPGARHSGNLLEWMLFDTRARRILPEPHWTRETHLLVGALHCLWPTQVPRIRLGTLLAELAEAPDFLRFWSTPISPAQIPARKVTLVDAYSGRTTQHFRQSSRPEFPDQRPWRIYAFPRSTGVATAHP